MRQVRHPGAHHAVVAVDGVHAPLPWRIRPVLYPVHAGTEVEVLKTEWNPLDIKPVGEMSLHGDARPLEPVREGGTVMVCGSPYRVTSVLLDGESATYGLEPMWLNS